VPTAGYRRLRNTPEDAALDLAAGRIPAPLF
jgi:hypothetical protein